MRTAQFSEVEVGSGRLVDLLCPDLEDICLWDVVNGLSGTSRFNGHVRPFYSTAQHSCVVASFLDEGDRIDGLLHDAAEYLIGDISSPVKSALRFICSDFDRAWKYLERTAEKAIYEAAGIPLPSRDARERVKRADLIALATEQRDVMRSPNVWNLPFPPADRKIVPVDSRAAFSMFVDALAECGVKISYPHGPLGEYPTFAPLAEPADPKELQNDGDPIRAAALPWPDTAAIFRRIGAAA